MIWRSIFAALLAAVTTLAAEAQDAAFTNRATDLKERASTEARTIAALPAETPVRVLQRAGGWTRVEAAAQSGWLRAFHLRFPAAVEGSASGGGGGLSGLTSALGFGKSAARPATIATTGIRGLTEEDFRNASPDPEALRRLQSYRVDRAAAERFAREARLVSVSIGDLMEEATTQGGRR